MDLIITGSYNRAVHAKAASISENPGSFFNPYFIHGAPGSGKTHFLNAVYHELRKTLGQDAVLFTNGMRLSKCIRRAVEQNIWPELDAQLSAYSALVVDDINLMSVSGTNRDMLAQTLNSFPGNRKQMVAASVFDRRALSDFETHWSLRVPSGYDGHITLPETGAMQDMILPVLDESEFPLDITLAQKLSGDDLTMGTARANIFRMRKLKAAMGSAFPEGIEEAVALLSIPQTAANDLPTAEELDDFAKLPLPESSTEWGRWAVYYPDGEYKMAHYTLVHLQTRAQELGIPGWFEQVSLKPYTNPNAYTSPIAMADECETEKVKGALLLGPMPSAEFTRLEKDFFHTFMRAFDDLGMQSATLGSSKLKTTQAYTRILVDLAL